MTIEALLHMPVAELEAMTDAQLETLLGPYLQATRPPDKNRAIKVSLSDPNDDKLFKLSNQAKAGLPKQYVPKNPKLTQEVADKIAAIDPSVRSILERRNIKIK